MISMFLKGGPVMWPLLLCSIVGFATLFERAFFLLGVRLRRQPKVVGTILSHVEKREPELALQVGHNSRDFIARVLTYALAHRLSAFSTASLRAAQQELKGFNGGLSVLDTIVTLAPLLGLLGTITGMISAFGLMGGSELGAPQAITGGIAEALIATAFGLSIAITALIPFNYLNARLEGARYEIEKALSQLEMLLGRTSEIALGEGSDA